MFTQVYFGELEILGFFFGNSALQIFNNNKKDLDWSNHKQLLLSNESRKASDKKPSSEIWLWGTKVLSFSSSACHFLFPSVCHSLIHAQTAACTDTRMHWADLMTSGFWPSLCHVPFLRYFCSRRTHFPVITSLFHLTVLNRTHEQMLTMAQIYTHVHPQVTTANFLTLWREEDKAYLLPHLSPPELFYSYHWTGRHQLFTSVKERRQSNRDRYAVGNWR